MSLVGARGLDPVVPTPRIVLPEWIANALRGPRRSIPEYRSTACPDAALPHRRVSRRSTISAFRHVAVFGPVVASCSLVVILVVIAWLAFRHQEL